ncbi:hypothetical protein FE845_00535 [Marinobacter sp. 1-4A]|uniref:GDSL-type esterase/lipase family protein n=1 Tax=Marinobacter sp. 1-4A TaxID=2582919 RepID=UPI001903D0EB|nr:GDSL-type esterase/lipase family protein [Marinobacter sp. 1-4A]MBK1849814.1 hypothetical protein [Marinobacter sp. 1-4A]
MTTGYFKFNFLISVFAIFALAYLGYQHYEDCKAGDRRVSYFIDNTEIILRRQLMDIPETAIPFYGDSLVHGLAVGRADPSFQNFGIGHDHTKNLYRRVQEDLKHRKLSNYAIAIGINDLSRGVAVDDIYQNIEATINSLKFAESVYLHTVLPVSASRTKAGELNEKVRDVNESLSKLSEKYENVVFVNTYRELAIDGFLPEHLHIGDGLHLNSEGSRKWIKILSSALPR